MVRQLATKSDFDAAIAVAGRAVVVAFTATWCGPCRAIAPVFEALSAEFTWADFVKVDVDQNQEPAMACDEGCCDSGDDAPPPAAERRRGKLK